MDAKQYVSIPEDKLLPIMENSRLSKRALSFNRIITLNTPPKGLKTGSNLKELGFLTGQHSHQTLALLSTSGNISRKDPMAMEDQQKEFGSTGRELRQSGGEYRLWSVRS